MDQDRINKDRLTRMTVWNAGTEWYSTSICNAWKERWAAVTALLNRLTLTIM